MLSPHEEMSSGMVMAKHKEGKIISARERDEVKYRAEVAQEIEDGKRKYRDNYPDNTDRWEQLAAKRGYLLPSWWVAPNTRLMRRWLRRVRIKERDYCATHGEDWKLQDFETDNPNWPLLVWVGLLLEYADELDNAKAVNKRHTHRE